MLRIRLSYVGRAWELYLLCHGLGRGCRPAPRPNCRGESQLYSAFLAPWVRYTKPHKDAAIMRRSIAWIQTKGVRGEAVADAARDAHPSLGARASQLASQPRGVRVQGPRHARDRMPHTSRSSSSLV